MNGSASFLVALVSVVLVGLFLWPRIAKAQQSPDAQVIAQLSKAGSVLSKPHPIEFFLYVPTREAADRLARKVLEAHFEVKVEPAAQGSKWLVLATKSLVPTEANLVAVRKQFTALAGAEKGEYDGWGTSVVK